MMTLSRSTVRIRSRITRYWLIGVSSESKCLAHSACQAFLAAAISSLSELQRVRAAAALPAADFFDHGLDDERRVAGHADVGAGIPC